MNIMENIIYYGVMIMNNSKPRWINEIPGIKNNGKKRKLTNKEKKEVKEAEQKNDTVNEVEELLREIDEIKKISVVKEELKNDVEIKKEAVLNKEDLKQASKLGFADYEDAIQSYQASRIKADYIVTRNIKDFNSSKIKAITPTELLLKIENK